MRQHSPNHVSVPIDGLRSDVAHALAVVAENGRALEAVGRTVFDGILDASFDEPSDELRKRASRMRCAARYAAALAIEVEAMASRLDGIALARGLAESVVRGRTSRRRPTKRADVAGPGRPLDR